MRQTLFRTFAVDMNVYYMFGVIFALFVALAGVAAVAEPEPEPSPARYRKPHKPHKHHG
ncbi:unnamed protein product [Nezara viridula]|uniref:Uncharacterized protein n=1 Tax=Nezara viridula TaxID=85310 RepID=A0A9P0MHV8_NEZVI|nr:unnamed protein product [Nezara viridula]